MSVPYIDLEKKVENQRTPVKISKEEALTIQYDLLSNWESQSDLWAMKWGRAVLASATVVSSLIFMNHYRKKLKLFQHGRSAMFFPGVVMPAFAVPIIHQKTVIEPILLGPQCAVCLQVRSAAIQGAMSVAYPIFVNSIASFFMANTFATYRLPIFSLSTIGEYFTTWMKFTKPISATLPFHILAQVVISFVVTEMEAKSFFTVQEQLVQRLKSSQNP